MITNISSSYAMPDLSAMRQNRFQKMDGDGDGKITKNEMSSAIPKSGRGPSVDDIFSKIDANQDGAIDEAEDKTAFEQMQKQFGARGPGGTPDSSKLAEVLFKAADSDTDGKISVEELTSVLKQKETSDSSNANKVFEAADTDKDGKITQSELQAFLESQRPSPPQSSGHSGYNGSGRFAQNTASASFSAMA